MKLSLELGGVFLKVGALRALLAFETIMTDLVAPPILEFIDRASGGAVR